MIKVTTSQTVTIEIDDLKVTLSVPEARTLADDIRQKLAKITPQQPAPVVPTSPTVVPPAVYPPYVVTCSTSPNAWNILERNEQTARSNIK